MSTRVSGLLAVALAAILAVPVVPILATAAGAQANGGTDSGGYTPCELGQQDVDLLVMMDASGSLNKPRGKDPDGELRSTALRDFRGLLAGLLERLPSGNADSVRLALWRFDTDATRIADFAPVADSHPSDAHLRQSLGDGRNGGFEYSGRHTHYLEALRSAESAFQSSDRPDACRVLLFFTDGLHDPTGELTGGRTDADIILRQADDLRREVCRDLKQRYERERINTYPILIGDFGVDSDGAEPDEDGGIDAVAEMAQASMQALRALTGDASFLPVRDLPYSQGFDCERWSDEQPFDRDGSIIGGDDEDLDVLAFLLLEIAETAARGLVEWKDCYPVSGRGGSSGPMPAGRYIETIVAYPRGSLIEGYEVGAAEGPVVRSTGDWNRPLYLESDDLSGLEAGWTLRILTDGGGDGVEVACYLKKEDLPAPVTVVEGNLTDSGGQPLPDVVRSPDGSDSPPFDDFHVEAASPPGLCENGQGSVLEVQPDERVLDWYCRTDGTAVLTLEPLECGNSYGPGELLLQYRYEPDFASEAFGPGQVFQEARIEIAGSDRLLYDCLGAPLLVCDAAEPKLAVLPDSDELPRERLRGTSDCRFVPPPEIGEAYLQAEWQPDDPVGQPGELDWQFDREYYDEIEGVQVVSDRELRLGPGSDPEGVELRFITADELENADWEIAGVIELVPTWETGVSDAEFNSDAEEQMAAQRRSIAADELYLARSDPGFARWLTLIVLGVSLLLSYLLFCLALASTLGLPNPGRFWWRHAVIGVEPPQRAGGRYSIARDAVESLAATPAEAVRGQRIRGSRYRQWDGPRPEPGADRINVELGHPPRLWLFGLLRGAWSEVRSSDNAVATLPKGRKGSRVPTVAVSRDNFDRLIVAGAPRADGSGGLVAPIWLAHPKTGTLANPEQLDERELTELLNEAAERNQAGAGDAADLGGSAKVPGGDPTSDGPEARPPEGDGPRRADPPRRPPPRRRPPL